MDLRASQTRQKKNDCLFSHCLSEPIAAGRHLSMKLSTYLSLLLSTAYNMFWVAGGICIIQKFYVTAYAVTATAVVCSDLTLPYLTLPYLTLP